MTTMRGSHDGTIAMRQSPPDTYDGRIRAAHPSDRNWLIPLSARLHEFGSQTWRSPDAIDRAVALSLEQVLAEPSSDAELRVAENAHHDPLGFVHLRAATDFTGELHSYVSDLVVSSAAQGRGVASALLREAESWALRKGHRLLALNVFTANDRARELYERVGFVADTIRMIKQLRASRQY